ncbi:hypothetical protein BFL28_11020 [Sphingomonas turrisvirgatae]|uniref:Uncharacterized protein n=2 Tax=Sphingomonas turrisvirgatae TaxID=1888892 RepID=A0A1E3M072_9SPHN|nr:hypothetical protein BFL28_11020 [Sphingomonas turrisvirgatae]
MAIVMAAINVLAFSVFALMGISSFGAPLYVHVHAITFFGWVAIYVTQTALAATGSLALHRKLGWFATGYTLWMVVMGTLTTVYTSQRGLTPPIFTPVYFLVMNPLGVLCFATMIFAAVAVRANTGWHRRLIYCAMASIMGPAFGRLLPPQLTMSPNGIVILVAALCSFIVIGMVRDLVAHRRVHPAWVVGLAVVSLQWFAFDLIAKSPLGVSIYDSVVAGTPGAAKPALEKASFPG